MNTHLIKCTYCEYRQVFPGDKKKHIPERELCRLTRQPIVPPDQPGRFCNKFRQIGHVCEVCYTDYHCEENEKRILKSPLKLTGSFIPINWRLYDQNL
jgi:hypothetical protein